VETLAPALAVAAVSVLLPVEGAVLALGSAAGAVDGAAEVAGALPAGAPCEAGYAMAAVEKPRIAATAATAMVFDIKCSQSSRAPPTQVQLTQSPQQRFLRRSCPLEA